MCKCVWDIVPGTGTNPLTGSIIDEHVSQVRKCVPVFLFSHVNVAESYAVEMWVIVMKFVQLNPQM